jgi:hypothetical protein
MIRDRVTRDRVLVGLHGLTGFAAIAALIVVLLQGSRLSSVDHHIREVHEQIVTLRLPPGVHARVLRTITRKGVVPGSPEVKAKVKVPAPGGRPAPARRRRRDHAPQARSIPHAEDPSGSTPTLGRCLLLLLTGMSARTCANAGAD